MVSELEAALLEAELSLIDDEYYGERTEESEVDIDEMSSERDSSDRESELVVMHMARESRDLDTKEIVKKFKCTSCGCKKKDGLPCSDYFSEEDISQLQMAMAELEPDQLDLVIFSQINAHYCSGELAGHRTTAELEKQSSRINDYTVFFHKGKTICSKTFLFIHYIGMKKFHNLLKHYRANGVAPRRHGNVKQRPRHAAPLSEKEHAINYVKNIAEAHALPLPGRLPNSTILISCCFQLTLLKHQYTGSMLKLQGLSQ